MITNNSISLPYPVLGLEGDFNNGGFTVKPNIQIIKENLHIVEDSIEISNEYIRILYENGVISTAYKIVCPSTFFNTTEVGRKEIIIPLEHLANFIVLEVYLVAVQDIANYSDSSFNEDYFLGNSKGIFEIFKGNIIGITGSIKIPLGKSWVNGSNSMFKFVRGENAFVSFDVETGDQIIITYPSINTGDLDIVQYMSRKRRLTFLNLFIIPALNHAFSELCKQFENGNLDEFIENHEWALIITETYEHWNDSDPYKSAQSYFMQLLEQKGSTIQIPIIEVFNELK